MSAFELPPEHIAALVHAGTILSLAQLPPMPEGGIVELRSHAGRAAVFKALWIEHRSALSEWNELGERGDRSLAVPADPAMPVVRLDLRTNNRLAQVIGWIRCYEYQTSRSSTWKGSFASTFCATLGQAVTDELIRRLNPGWIFQP